MSTPGENHFERLSSVRIAGIDERSPFSQRESQRDEADEIEVYEINESQAALSISRNQLLPRVHRQNSCPNITEADFADYPDPSTISHLPIDLKSFIALEK